MSIELLASNRPAARFYRGGARIAQFRGEEAAGAFEPEDWMGSVTSVAGEEPAGLSTLSDGRLLADAIARDPRWWLGDEHVASFGADPMLLVKLLDAGQRLPVHAHPDRHWAAAHLGAAHGKTEAWYVLTAGPVWLGFAREVGRTTLDDIVERQDAGGLLDAMHRIDVHAGDVVLVPAGMLHAIGEGILLVELQEPEDLSILIEWEGFAIDGAARGHLGVGFATALEAVESRSRSRAEIEALIHRAGSSAPLLPGSADPFFRLERITVVGEAVIDRGFSVAVVLAGAATLTATLTVAPTDTVASRAPILPARPVSVRRGSTALLAHAAGDVVVTGTAELLVCRPPIVR